MDEVDNSMLSFGKQLSRPYTDYRWVDIASNHVTSQLTKLEKYYKFPPLNLNS